MQISRKNIGKLLELKVEGRLDVYWADHLAAAVDEEIRQGSHHIRLDLASVAFLSSAGIGVLVRIARELKSIGGSFAVWNCSPSVQKILEISKLDKMLIGQPGEPAPADAAGPSSGAGTAEATAAVEKLERAGVVYEIYPLAAEAKLECRPFGDAGRLARAGFAKEDCKAMQFSDASFAIGLGAFGENFDDCRGRFGEFIAVGGAVAYLPTDGTNVADFLVGGRTTPEVQVCYGIACDGRNPQAFSRLLRFEAKQNSAPVTLTALLESCLEIANCDALGVVAIAESAGLVGAALRRSPVAGETDAEVFAFPKIREWLTFTAERAHTKSAVLLAGVVVRGSVENLAPMVRPFSNSAGAGQQVVGHFHAAAFGYRPVPKGQIDLKASVKTLFEKQPLEGVLHLLHDDRTISAAGQSEFVRGACWVAPIGKIAAEGAAA